MSDEPLDSAPCSLATHSYIYTYVTTSQQLEVVACLLVCTLLIHNPQSTARLALLLSIALSKSILASPRLSSV